MMTTGKDLLQKTKRITGIGSLPHHNIDAALDYSLKMGIPFLPQIPIRNPWEYMIPQALEGLPGLQIESDGTVILNTEVWASQSHILSNRLESAFQSQSFENFEPGSSISSCWQPFLWELQEREIPLAKIQIAGPFTCQWALRFKEGSVDPFPEFSTQIFQLILARSLAMTKRMLSCKIQPILYLDEPGLYALSTTHPRHVLCLRELKLMIQTLQKQGAIVGIHCCSDTDWDAITQLGLDILSLDTQLSLAHALSQEKNQSIEKFIQTGGRLSLGVIPTNRSGSFSPYTAKELIQSLFTVLNKNWEHNPEFIRTILGEAIFTPACGLALQSTSDAELILERLVEVYGSLALH